jgi:MFS family permease
LSAAQISSLFVVWSVVGIVAEVPTGALADRFSRPLSLVAAGMLQAAGYGLWIAAPGYAAFAAGFVLWGLGGSFGSGALEALLYDAMAAAGAESHYPRVYGRVSAARLLSQVPAALAATVLFSTGGYELVGWASVACCLGAAAVATRLPDARDPGAATDGGDGDDTITAAGYLDVVRRGLTEAARCPAVWTALVAVALVGSLDGLEEYFSLLAQDWGVPTPLVPLVLLAIPLAGAAGATLGGRPHRLGRRGLAALLAGAVAMMVGAALLRRPAGVAGVAIAYGLYRFVLVGAEAGLQQRIEGRARATVTSVAALGTDVIGVALYAAWASNQPALVAGLAFAIAAGLPWLLRPRAAVRAE